MRIILNKDFAITTDEFNFTLVKIKIRGEEAVNAGEEYDYAVGYYGSLELALVGFVKHYLRSSENTLHIKEVAKELEKIKALIKNTKIESMSEDSDVANKKGVANPIKTVKTVKTTRPTKSKGEIAKENLDAKSKKKISGGK